MKKIILLFFLVISVINAKSQLTKGNWLVGGTGSFYSFKEQFGPPVAQDAKYSSFEISPAAAYFITDKFVMGIKPSFTSIKGRVTSTGGLRTNVQRYWIGPFARYYFLEKENQYNILTDVSYQTGFFGGGLAKGNLETFSAMAGPVIFFNSSVGMELLLGYRYRKEESDGGSKIINNGLWVSVGFQIHLEKL